MKRKRNPEKPDPTFSAEVNYPAEVDSATDGGTRAEKLQEAELLVRQDVGERPFSTPSAPPDSAFL